MPQTPATEITMVGTLPPTIGISDVCLEQVRHLSKLFQVRFICFKQIYPEFLYPGGTRLEGFEMPPLENLEIDRSLTWYNPISWIIAAFRLKGEVVHFQWWTYVLFFPLFCILLLAKLQGKRTAANVHNALGHESNRLDRFFTKLFLSFCDDLIVHSEDTRIALQTVLGLKSKRIEVIELGSPDFLVKKQPQEEARERLGLSQNDFVLLYFGNIRHYKGVDDLLEAMAILKPKYANLKLIIAGKPWVEWQPYAEQIERLGLKENVLVRLDYIPVDEVPYYFSASDVLVLPYKYFHAQSGPGRLAVGYRLPMLVTAVGGLPELVTDTLCVVKAAEPGALARKISFLIESPDTLVRLSAELNSKAKEFSWEESVRKMSLVFDPSLEGSSEEEALRETGT